MIIRSTLKVFIFSSNIKKNFAGERVDKFIWQSIITFNKLHDIETVSQGSRHRSNHTQKSIPSVVAGNQFLQFGCISPDTGIFPSQRM